MTANPDVENAARLGADAFARGVKCAPALDANILATLAGRPVGDCRTIPELKAWSAGWVRASLAAAFSDRD